MLNFEDFYYDLKRLKKEYFDKVKSPNNGKYENFSNRLYTLGFLGTMEEMNRLKNL